MKEEVDRQTHRRSRAWSRSTFGTATGRPTTVALLEFCQLSDGLVGGIASGSLNNS